MEDFNKLFLDVGYLKGKVDSIEVTLKEIKPLIENKSKSKYYLSIITVLLVGVFGWLSVLTYCIITAKGVF